MGAKIRINPIVTTDLQEIKDYIAQDNPDAALRTVRSIISKIESLAEFPLMGAALAQKIKVKSNYRYLVEGNYLIFYIYEGDMVSIQRVLHAKRDYLTLLSDER